MRPTKAMRRKMVEMAGEPPPTMPRVQLKNGGRGQAPEQRTRRRERTPGGYRRYSLILNKIEPESRDKFRSLSHPESYYEIKKGDVGSRVAYSVNLTDAEHRQALEDSIRDESNLLHVEEVSRDLPNSNAVTPGVVPMRYHRANHANNMDLTGEGVRIGSIDTGISSEIASLMGSKIFTSQGFMGIDPLDYCPPDAVYPQAHGSQMTPIACPPRAKIAIAGTGDEDGFMYTDTTAAAMNWLADEAGVHIIYVEVSHAPSTVVAEAVASAAGSGVIVLAAAGNDGHGLDHSPAADPGCLAIAAYSATTDARMDYSNYGDHIWAAACCGPGVMYNPDASSNAFDDSFGGTSTAVAIAADLFARRMTGGKSAAEVKSMMQRMARPTGAAAIYEGHGVLRLPKPLATTTRYNANVDAPEDERQPTSDPTDPQWRTRGQDDPEPTYDPEAAPVDSGVNQAGNSEGGQYLAEDPAIEAQTACQAQLQTLVDAVNASPTAENTRALRMFVEQQTRAPIQNSIPAWGHVIDDGVERTARTTVCGVQLEVTLSGDLLTSASCALLPTEIVSFPQNDFDLPTTVTSTVDWPGSYPHTFVTEFGHPDITVHLDDPVMVWLNYTDDKTLIDAQRTKGYFQTNVYSGSTHTTIAGKEWYRYLRVKYRWTCKIAQHSYAHWDAAFGPPFQVGGGVEFFTKFPVMGFREILRWPEAVDVDFWAGTLAGAWHIGTPMRTGSVVNTPPSRQIALSQDCDLPVMDRGGPAFLAHGDSFNDFTIRDGTFHLPYKQLGPPDFSPTHASDWSGSGTGNFLSFGSQERSNEVIAWAEFMELIDDWQANNGDYDPVLELDEENMTITVIAETDKNAMYLPMGACATSGGNEPDTAPQSTWTASWGDYWHDTGWGGGAGSYTQPNPKVSGDYSEAGLGEGQFLAGVARRIIHPELFPEGT